MSGKLKWFIGLVVLIVLISCSAKKLLPTAPDIPPVSTPTTPVIPLSIPADRWVGLTSFRLLELEAHGHADQAQATLAWAQSNGVTILRVLATAVNLFTLTTPDGYKALPALCQDAHSTGEHLEIVALADTSGWDLGQLKNQVGEIGHIMAASCLGDRIEVANEPYHWTQDNADLSNPSTLRMLADLVPSSIPTAEGAAQDDTSTIYAGRDYMTIHSSRLSGWADVDHYFDLFHAWAHSPIPVIDDEPIGADQTTVPGSRDADPDRWRARGALMAAMQMGETFHCQTCLEGLPPQGQELVDFQAWREGMNAVRSRPGMVSTETGPLATKTTNCLALADSGWGTIVCVDTAAAQDPTLVSGWTIRDRQSWNGLLVLTVQHGTEQ